MPFKKRNGEYYFEAVELFGDIEHNELHAALCPLCAAKYKEFVKKDEENLRKFRHTILEGNASDIPLSLDDNSGYSIRFVQRHFHDLKTIFRKLTRHD